MEWPVLRINCYLNSVNRFLQKYPEYPKPYEAPHKICLDEVAKELSKYTHNKLLRKGLLLCYACEKEKKKYQIKKGVVKLRTNSSVEQECKPSLCSYCCEILNKSFVSLHRSHS